MPPKRWGALPPARLSRDEAVQSLTRYVCEAIAQSNSLGLPDDELAGMAKVLVESRTRAEVLEWCKTLLLDEAVAAEVIKRRVDYGLSFAGETASPPPPARERTDAATTAAATTTATAGRQLTVKSGTTPSRNKGSNNNSKTSKSGDGKQTKTTAPRRRDNETAAAASEAVKPGRCECGCFATRHKLRSNCLNCGRIICEQEDDRVCYFCNLPPARCVAYEIALQEGRLSDAAQARDAAAYAAAVAQRDKLLAFARQRARRTAVIDDQAASLFDPQNAWLSPEERVQAHKTAAAVAQQRRIAAMHAHSGAYEVQLQLMGQTVPLSVSKGQPVQIDLVVGRDGRHVATAAASPHTSDSDDNDDDSDGDDSDDAAAEATSVEGRALAMSDVLQSIWHDRVDDATRTTATTAMAAVKTPAPVQRDDEQSRRVQQDYFADDVRLYHRAKVTAADENEASSSDAATTVAVTTTTKGGDDDDDATTTNTALPELVFDPHKLIDAAADDTRTRAADAATATTTGDDGDGGSGPQSVSTLLPLRFAPTPAMRLRDEGVCLSMHQPWASLLVAGIKRHEGRVWPTAYRGRLWIHAAASEPRAVAATTQHYAPFVPPGASFPTHYPTRVLLGYVYLTACLDRAAYEAAFAPHERQEESPYSFICAAPTALPFPLPMHGAHKLFTLEHKVHTAARKQLGETAL